MTQQGVVLQRFFFSFYMLLMISSKLVESTPSDEQELDSKTEAAQDTRTVPLYQSSIHRTNEVSKPSQIRNRRSNLLTENEQFIDDNPGLDSAFLYSDQIMQNLLKTQSPKPLNYARSNFFLNLLKPRTTRYNAWDDHSLMHFGKRSVEGTEDSDSKRLVKRSADIWSPNNVMHFGKKSIDSTENDGTFQDGVEIRNFEGDENVKSEEANSDIPWNNELDPKTETLDKKSADPWHSMMSFGKKSENPWDHNTMHFGKRDDPWHDMMSFGKKSDPWHSMMSFGKKSDPWHNMMSFGKRSENPWDHSTLHFGKKDDPWHNMMSFGKRSENPWDHNTLHFGKRDDPWHNMMSFGKKSDPWHNMMSFGKKSDPWHSMMSFGKKSDNPWDHNTLHFGKRDDPWHNMMSFGKRPDNSDMTDLEKRDDPWHNMMSFGKKSDNLGNNSSVSADKREEPWHSMMSFGKKSDNDFGEHFTLHFGKRDEPWHNMMSFGKKSDFGFDHNTLHFGKREEPWHSMMSFGKKSDNPWDHNTLHFGKKDEPWHNMMSFGKKSDSPWGDHNTMHFGKRDEPWHNMMSFGKRSDGPPENDLLEDFGHSNPWEEYNGMVFYKKSDPWDHNTLHFGKKSNTSLDSILSAQNDENLKHIQKRSAEMWNDHHTMHFGKKSDPWESHNTMHFGKKSDPWESHNTMHFGKKSDPWESHNTMHFGKKSEADDFENTMNIDKKFDWDHNTLHFGKKSEPWDNHNTMHFGKKRDPWDYHNTMHFGKRNPWEYHNTMHFGKKRDPWDYHNTMHFGKRSDSSSKEDKLKDTDDMKKDNEHNSSENLKSTKNYPNNDSEKQISETHGEPDDNQKLAAPNLISKRSLTNVKSHNEKDKIVEDNKQLASDFTSSVKEQQTMKPSISDSSKEKDHKRNKTHISETDTKSRIKKRSVESVSFDKPIDETTQNMEPNAELFEEYSRDYFPETVLHFGKRSTDNSEDDYKQQDMPLFDVPEVKRFDDYWDNHNTMHFGKKSDPWESHSTLHFGKKSSPWEQHSTLHFGKRDPFDYHNTLHFGKKFDPWEGHAKMHFGKRTADWDHNVMHFGKRGRSTPEDALNTDELVALIFDPVKLNELLRGENDQGGMNSAQERDFLESIANLEAILISQLKDESIPLEEKLLLLKSYLKPILKAILNKQVSDEISFKSSSFPYSENFNDRDVNNNEMVKDREGIIFMPDINYENLLPNENEEVNEDDYGENSKTVDFLKSKRGYLGKPELKRYFIPFQGPKSIVYPHAWFASQIRRSALPKTTEYARRMEMRMAEKKEDPFNSYMHFGRR